MLIQRDRKKKLINFLLDRWSQLTDAAAISRINIIFDTLAQENKLPISQKSSEIQNIIDCKPEKQINILKKFIIKIIPKAKFINYQFEAQAPLALSDFVEIYIADHQQCITKVHELIDQLKIS